MANRQQSLVGWRSAEVREDQRPAVFSFLALSTALRFAELLRSSAFTDWHLSAVRALDCVLSGAQFWRLTPPPHRLLWRVPLQRATVPQPQPPEERSPMKRLPGPQAATNTCWPQQHMHDLDDASERRKGWGGNEAPDTYPPPRCISHANVHNYYGPYTYCSLDKGVACAPHIQLLTHTYAGHMC